MKSNQQVQHTKFGLGTVLVDNGATQIVRFEHGIEEVPLSELEIRLSVRGALEQHEYKSSLKTVLRTQSAAIQSVNDSWGIFSRSRIKLLPHQLWTCHETLKDWPIRKLIADDVGLGKTIEAGLILWPLIASKKVVRLLILTPAPLVEQWQQRMREMFDIRLSIYKPELEKGKADFWNTHSQVVASLPTLRADKNNRHDQLLESEDWDLVLVDEAHHLHATEMTGKTLGFKLLEKLLENQKITSLLLFTGTPHRGKPYGFWSLMSLLDSETFGPQKKDAAQLPYLSKYLIRNYKQKVVDMEGKLLFKPIQQFPETYEYTKAESEFYTMMTSFIQAGHAYASSLSSQGRGQVTLVLIALQKLASSSVAAVRNALITRKNNLLKQAGDLRTEASQVAELSEDETDAALHGFTEWVKATRKASLQLMEDEIANLEQLIQAAVKVTEETRVQRILQITKTRFANRSVLIFTEYKTTQALIVSALVKEYGEHIVGFINGENKLNNVVMPDGTSKQLSATRDYSADAFNAGKTKFLVSTEAAGEGIDLQVNCHCLIHADLPWNPMRLHQRVGRLNRYGQKHSVEVVSLRNPSTIESKIWLKLEEKIQSIMVALGAAMTDSEDLMQLVLGMASPDLFDEIFTQANRNPDGSLNEWFDEQTQTLGGKNAIQTVSDLVGNAQSFDLSGLKGVPKLDLIDLLPFFKKMVEYNKRRFEGNADAGFNFITPDDWRLPSTRRKYSQVYFNRSSKDGDIIGIGHPVMGQAIHQANNFSSRVALIPGLAEPIFVFMVVDRVTTGGGLVRASLVGVRASSENYMLIRDHQLVVELNCLLDSAIDDQSERNQPMVELFDKALYFLKNNVCTLDLPFDFPEIIEYSAFIPNGESVHR